MSEQYQKPTAIDLFAGAGGATQGLRDADYDVVAAVEFDRVAARTYRANHEETFLAPRDLLHLSPTAFRSHLEKSGRLQRRLDLLNACPPCQGFSSRGARNAKDGRNDLALKVVDWVRAFEPRAVVVENVPGLKSDERYDALYEALQDEGYGVRPYVENAVRFGVPQSRRRLIVLAIHGLSDRDLPNDLAEAVPPKLDRGLQKAGEWIAKASEAPKGDPLARHRTLKAATLARVKEVGPGGSRFDLPDHLQLDCHKALDAKVGGKRATESYGRIDPDGPAPTMTTRCTTVSCGRFTHPSEDRGLTLREAALLQTFPPDYAFEGTYGQIERQIGNALPVKMTQGVALVASSLASSCFSSSPSTVC